MNERPSNLKEKRPKTKKKQKKLSNELLSVALFWNWGCPSTQGQAISVILVSIQHHQYWSLNPDTVSIQILIFLKVLLCKQVKDIHVIFILKLHKKIHLKA